MLLSYNRIIKASSTDAGKEIISTPNIQKLNEIIEARKANETNENEAIVSEEEFIDPIDIINDAKHQAKLIIEDAKQKFIESENSINKAKSSANEIISSAQLEAENIKENSKENGYKSGYQEGYRIGIDEAGKEADAIRNDTEIFVNSAKNEVESYIKSSEKEIIELAVEISRQIINAELSINQDAIINIAEKAISNLIDKKQIILKVNPVHFDVVKANKEAISKYIENSNDLFVLADSKMSIGSVRIETPSGIVDASLETQIDTFIKKLIG